MKINRSVSKTRKSLLLLLSVCQVMGFPYQNLCGHLYVNELQCMNRTMTEPDCTESVIHHKNLLSRSSKSYADISFQSQGILSIIFVLGEILNLN